MGPRSEVVIEEEEFGFMISMEKCAGMIVLFAVPVRDFGSR